MQKAVFPLYSFYISKTNSNSKKMYGLYDREGILRFVDSDKDACLAYADLFELGSTNYCLMDLADERSKLKETNLDLNRVKNNN